MPSTTNLSPNFFVVGAARCGTTALAEMLRQHPDVFITQPKEPHFLAFAGHPPSFDGPGDEAIINRIAVTDPEAYRALYSSAAGRRARGDASVSSLYYAEDSLANLERYFPDARLVVILREPVARAFSAYSYQRVRGFEPCTEFAAAIDQELDGQRRTWHHLWQYVDMGRYARQLRPYLERWGSQRMLVLFHDELRRDSVGVSRRLFRHLGVDDGVSVAADRVNISGKPRNALVQRTIRWTAGQRHARRAVQAVLPYRVRERIKRLNIDDEQTPDEATQLLHELYAPEVAELRELLHAHYDDELALPVWLAGVPAPTLQGGSP
jgi:hypothetical protein